MELEIIRRSVTPESSEGVLFVGAHFECYTLEDTVRDGPKVYGKTAIPDGRYELVLTWSPRFKQVMPLVRDVPGFKGIRIHWGNKPADTEGCPLVGDVPTRLDDNWVGASKVAYRRLLKKLQAFKANGEPMYLTVTTLPKLKERTA